MRARGFTLVELIVVIAILSLLMVATVPIYTSFTSFNVVQSYKQEMLQNIRLAQTSAESGKAASAFGVYVESDQYVMYQGATYASRVVSEDRVFVFESTVRASGLAEVNFAKKTGLPSAIGTITLTHSANNRQEIITINAAGFIY